MLILFDPWMRLFLQKELGMVRRKFKLSIHAREKELLELQQAVDTLKVRGACLEQQRWRGK